MWYSLAGLLWEGSLSWYRSYHQIHSDCTNWYIVVCKDAPKQAHERAINLPVVKLCLIYHFCLSLINRGTTQKWLLSYLKCGGCSGPDVYIGLSIHSMEGVRMLNLLVHNRGQAVTELMLWVINVNRAHYLQPVWVKRLEGTHIQYTLSEEAISSGTT